MKVNIQRDIGKFKIGDTIDVSPFVADYLKKSARNEKQKGKKGSKAGK